MPLNFDLSKIVDASPEGMQFVWPEYDAETNPAVSMNPKVESIIFATMSTGINKITEDNAVEFYSRYRIVCLAANRQPFFSVGDVHKAIGLKTNASSITPAAFKKHVYDIIERDINWKVQQDMKDWNLGKDSDES